jgi:hypothetical protein
MHAGPVVGASVAVGRSGSQTRERREDHDRTYGYHYKRDTVTRIVPDMYGGVV